MIRSTLGGQRTIKRYVSGKLAALQRSEPTFAALFPLMFSEEDNVMYERSEGYRIVKTTYGECRRRILRRAATLAALLKDTPENAVVGLAMQNSLSWIELFWCILLCGRQPLLVNVSLDPAVREAALREANAVAVVSDGAAYSLRTILADEVSEADAPLVPGVSGECLFVMSSGTTGQPKLCAYSAREIASQIADSSAIIRSCPQIKKHCHSALKLLAFLPFYHIFGLVAVYFWFGFFSRTFVHLQDLSPQTLLNTIRRHEVTHIFAVPMLWNTVYKQASREIKGRGEKTWAKLQKGLDLVSRAGVLSKPLSRLLFRQVRQELFGSSVRFMITGGSEISPEVLRFLNGIGYPLSNGYGMSETGITAVELSPRFRLRTDGAIGRPLRSVTFRLAEDGELLVSGPSTAKYLLADGVRRDMRGTVFATGDLAREEHGRYFMLGRKDDLVIGPSGENLNPAVIEPRLAAPGIREIALIADKRTSPAQPLLLASVSPAADPDALRGLLTARLAELNLAGQISRIAFTDRPLIREDEFKLNRTAIARRLDAGEIPLLESEGKAEDGTDPLTRRVREIMARILGKEPEDIRDDSDFFADGGGTSLDYFALTSELQDTFDVPVPISQGSRLTTPARFSEYLREALKTHD